MTAANKWGMDNEHSALMKYHQNKKNTKEHVDLCAACGLVVNWRWPWLGASPDGLVSDARQKSLYGTVEVKCPASKCDKTIVVACSDKSFCIELVKGKPYLKNKHIYYFQCHGAIAICQLNFIDFVVNTLSDIHVERIYLSNVKWEETNCFIF